MMTRNAHKHASHNKAEVRGSKFCGCFYCLKTFPAVDVKKWVGRPTDTALCPNCGIDSVIGSKSGYPVGDHGFLKRMYRRWFDPDTAARAGLRPLKKP